MQFNTDALDEFCEKTYGHTNWEFVETLESKIVVVFHKEDEE